MNIQVERISLMQAVIFLFLGLLGIFIQGTVVRMLFPGVILPALSLILVVYLAFFHSTPRGAVLSFFLGLEYDLFSGAVVGPWAGAFVVVFAFFALFTPRIFVDSPLVTFLIGFLASMGASAVFALICFLAPGVPVATIVNVGHLQQLVIEALAMAVCTPFLFPLLLRNLASRSEKQMSYAY